MKIRTGQKPAPFEAILVWKLSRFARNREDSIIYKSLLRKQGIQVISFNEPLEDTPSRRLLEGIIEVIDEFYSANLSQDVIRGMRAHRGDSTPAGHRLTVNGYIKSKGSGRQHLRGIRLIMDDLHLLARSRSLGSMLKLLWRLRGQAFDILAILWIFVPLLLLGPSRLRDMGNKMSARSKPLLDLVTCPQKRTA